MSPLKTIPKASNSPITCVNDNVSNASSQEKFTLVKRTIIEENTFDVYSHCVCFYPPSRKFENRRKKSRPRGNISDFSKRSRFRLFKTLSQIKSNLLNKPFFVTLTYHYAFTKRGHSTKSNLHSFLVSLRDFDKDVQFIWRIEYQKRGAPHYHLLIFPSVYKKVLNRKKYLLRVCSIWHKIADPESKAHEKYGCKVVEIENYRKACAYMSKYIAKLPEGAVDITEGKHWGNSRELPVKLYKSIVGCCNNGAFIIEKIRKWFLDNGKEQYASDYYFNVDRPQVIFIDAKEFFEVIGYDTSRMDFSDL